MNRLHISEELASSLSPELSERIDTVDRKSEFSGIPEQPDAEYLLREWGHRQFPSTPQRPQPIVRPAIELPSELLALNPLASVASSANQAELQVRLLPLSDITERELGEWRVLESISADRNPFLSPDFVLPAWRHLRPESQPLLLVISRGTEWWGVGVFEAVRPRKGLLLSYLRHWRSPHCFLQGMLLRRGETEATLQACWRFLKSDSRPWHALEFTHLARDSECYRALHKTAQEQGINTVTGGVHSRACLWLNPAGSPPPEVPVTSKRKRSLRQAMNWLERQGELTFAWQPAAADPLSREQERSQFLDLEARGWKSREGTALRCTESNRLFFQELTENFARRDRLYYSQLALSGQAIGTVVHLQAGNDVYAFKLGWDPDYARGCPGYQMKAQLSDRAMEQLPGVRLVDSCACEESFIGHVWPGRREIAGSLFLTSRAGLLARRLVNTLRWVRDCGKRWVQTQPRPTGESHD